MTVKEEIYEIDEQMGALRVRRRELEKQERAEFLKKARENIGRCFIVNGTQYVMVVGVPIEEQHMDGAYFNEYQYPAIYIDQRETIPFYEDTLFSGAWGVGHDSFTKYEEISPQAFMEYFEQTVNDFRRLLLSAADIQFSKEKINEEE